MMSRAFLSPSAQDIRLGPLLAVPEPREHRVVLVDPKAKTIIGSIPVPGWPHEIAFSDDGRTAYVPSYSDTTVGLPGSNGQTIDVIDMQTRSVRETWDLGMPLRPHKPMLIDRQTLLLTTEEANSLSIVDIGTGQIREQIPTGASGSHMFVITADRKKIYTVNILSGSVSVLDLRQRKLVKIIPVSARVQRIALSKDDKQLFVSDGSSRNVVVIDTATDAITRTIPTAGTPFAVHASPEGRLLLVGEVGESKGILEVVDLKDLTIQHTFDVDRTPFGIEVYNAEAFVTCNLSGNINVLNMSTWTLEAPIADVAHGDGIRLWQGLR